MAKSSACLQVSNLRLRHKVSLFSNQDPVDYFRNLAREVRRDSIPDLNILLSSSPLKQIIIRKRLQSSSLARGAKIMRESTFF